MERVRKLVSVPDDIGEGQAKVTVAVLDTGERVMVLHCGSGTVISPAEFSGFCVSNRLTFGINNGIINN